MRTGAIFARGSCRALKWMALMVAFAVLGSTQAAAQAPTFSSAVYDGSDTVMVTMSKAVYAGGTLAPGLFTIGANVATAHTVPMTPGAASATFTITFTDDVTATGSLAYAVPTDTSSGGIMDVNGLILGAASIATTPRPISLGLVTDISVPKGAEMAAVQLPMATGGVGDISYSIPAFGATTANTHTPGELPPGLEFLTRTRRLSGIATGDVGTRYRVDYTATDSDSGGTPNTDTVQFYVTVVAAPTAPGAPTISMTGSTVTNTTITVMWDPPTSGMVMNYEFRYGAMGSPVAARTTMFTPTTSFKIENLLPG